MSIFINLLHLFQRHHLLLVSLHHEVAQFVTVRLLLSFFAEKNFVALMLLLAVAGKDHYFFKVINDCWWH